MKAYLNKPILWIILLLLPSCSFKEANYRYYGDEPVVPVTARSLSKPMQLNSVDLELLEWAIFNETNEQRKRLGGKPFKFAPKLRTAAQNHSEEMVELNYFDHVSPTSESRTTKKRVENVGISSGITGENIAIHPLKKVQNVVFHQPDIKHWASKYNWRNNGSNYTYGEFAQDLVRRWLNSPPHRQNILNPQYKYLGVGCVQGKYDERDVFYITQNFASRNY